MRSLTLVLRAAVAATATAATVLLAAGPAHATPDPSPPTPDNTVLLPTGDRVVLGAPAPTVLPVFHDGRADGFTISTLAGHQYVVPNSVQRAPANVVDKSLFDVTYLHAHPNALHDLQVQFKSGDAQAGIPGLRIGAVQHGVAAADLVDPSAFRGALDDPAAFRDVQRISVSGDGPVARPNYPMFTLRLNITGLPGVAVAGWLTLLNVDDGTRFAAQASVAGGTHLLVSVPRGHYSVIGDLSGWDENGLVKGEYLVALPEFTVAADTTQTLDVGTATQPIDVQVPRPTVDRRQQATLFRTDARGQSTSISYATDAYYDRRPTDQTIYVAPTTRAPSHGTLQLRVLDTRTRPVADASDDYTYDLNFIDDGVIGANQRHVVRPRDLAEIHSTYRGLGSDGAPSHAYRTMFPVRLGDSQLAMSGLAIETPGRYAMYVTAGKRLTWQQQTLGLLDIANPSDTRAFMSDAARTYAPGARVTENWYQPLSYPRPIQAAHLGADGSLETYCPSCLHDGKLDLDFSPGTDDRLDHWSVGDDPTDRQWQLYGDDVPLAGGTDVGIIRSTVDVPAAAQTLRLSYDVHRPSFYRYSTSSHTEWTFPAGRGIALPRHWTCTDDSGGCRVLPVLTAAYHLGIGMDGSMTPGRHTGTVVLSHVAGASTPISSVRLELSYNGGDTWTPASTSLVGGTAHVSFTVPAGGTPALRLVARDAHRATLTQIIHQPFAIGAA